MRTLSVIWAGAAIVMLTAGISWKIVLLSLSLAFLLVILLRRFYRDHDGFLWVATVERPDLKKVRCEDCEGCGALWLDPQRRRWVILPHELRRLDSTAPYVRAPLANVRACECCQSRGFHLVPMFGQRRPTLAELAELPVSREEGWGPDSLEPGYDGSSS